MLENSSINAYQPAINYPGRQTGNIATYQRSGQITEKENFSLSTDQVSLSYSSESVVTYDSSMTLQGNRGDGFDLLRGLILNIFKEQGVDYKIAAGETEIDISKITPEEAQDLVADYGYFGVEKTSQRIFDLAVGIAGGDPARIDAIRTGVEKGFQEAFKAMGNWLPDISYDTYDAVMQKLDDWAGVGKSQQS
ncbi:MAG: hypothetical protein KJ630_17510 [Proteobacteria bacterium]|nr:hypothetical protein [Pseudomonadota bacterium]